MFHIQLWELKIMILLWDMLNVCDADHNLIFVIDFPTQENFNVIPSSCKDISDEDFVKRFFVIRT